MTFAKPWVVLAICSIAAVWAGFVLPPGTYLALVALVLLASIGILALGTQLNYSILGLALLVVSGTAFPFEFRGPGGVLMGSSLPLASFLCFAWLLRATVLGQSRRLDGSRVVYATFAFVTVALVSFAVGQYPWFPAAGAPLPAQVVELALFLVSAVLFLAVGHQVRTLGQLKALTWLFVAAGLVTCMVQMLPSMSGIGRWTTRPGSVGSLFWTWLAAVSFAQALFNRRLSTAARVILFATTALVLFHGLFNVRSWASGWIPALAAVAVILLVRLPRLSVSLGLLVLPIGVFLFGYVSDALMAEEAYSLTTRQEAWRVLWSVVERSPIIGTGLANYYYYTEQFPILGWYVRFFSHNNYQDLLIQTGLVGLLVFCWLAFEIFWLLMRLYPQMPEGFARAYVAGAIGGLVGSLVSGMLGDWIIPFYYNAGILGFRSSLLFWVFLGGGLALKRMHAGRAAIAVGVPSGGSALRHPLHHSLAGVR